MSIWETDAIHLDLHIHFAAESNEELFPADADDELVACQDEEGPNGADLSPSESFLLTSQQPPQSQSGQVLTTGAGTGNQPSPQLLMSEIQAFDRSTLNTMHFSFPSPSPFLPETSSLVVESPGPSSVRTPNDERVSAACIARYRLLQEIRAHSRTNLRQAAFPCLQAQVRPWSRQPQVGDSEIQAETAREFEAEAPLPALAALPWSIRMLLPKRARVLYNFEALADSEMSVEAGEEVLVEIVHRVAGDHAGWSYARNSQGKRGYVPTSYLENLAL